MLFRARQFEFRFPRPALIMGIVNVTPDSFSDGGKFLDADAAVARARELLAQGAEILDIGGESTRPGAEPVSEAGELRRVIPVIEKLAAIRWDARPTRPVLLSIDTMKPAVARAALAAGASIVNDVAATTRTGDLVRSSAFRRPVAVDEPNRRKAELQTDEMWKVVSEFRAGYICMHAQGSPPTMQKNPVYTDVVREVGEFFLERLEKLNAGGISPDQVIFDPGIGFGKTAEHNLQLLANLRRFATLSRPLLLGVSRKSFIEKISGARLNERLPASLACATLAIADGVQIIRTHDVAETIRAVRMAEAVLNRKQNA
jgi:dihydropteroate synthase